MTVKRPPTSPVIYTVVFDPRGNRWSVYRNGKPTGVFARDIRRAVASACTAASREGEESDLKIEVWSEHEGKRTKEWPLGTN